MLSLWPSGVLLRPCGTIWFSHACLNLSGICSLIASLGRAYPQTEAHNISTEPWFSVFNIYNTAFNIVGIDVESYNCTYRCQTDYTQLCEWLVATGCWSSTLSNVSSWDLSRNSSCCKGLQFQLMQLRCSMPSLRDNSWASADMQAFWLHSVRFWSLDSALLIQVVDMSDLWFGDLGCCGGRGLRSEMFVCQCHISYILR